jgi:pimeloyl-ACP methyl ester carboxylesterase
MPYASARDGTKLYYEEAGKGTPLVFVHEFAGDYRSWEAQMRYFSRRYRCITYNARGYPPSDVPRARAKYSPAIAIDDIADLMRHLKLREAHIVGCSMGGYNTLQFGIHHAPRALSITAIGAGAGSNAATRKAFLKASAENARRFEEMGADAALRGMPLSAGRVPQKHKDPRGFAEWQRWHREHSGLGLANTQRGLQSRRPTLFQLERELRDLKMPVFIVVGDEDDNCVPAAVFIKQVCPNARLLICPATGHAVNTEEPDLLNRMLLDFLTLVDSGRWRPRYAARG